MGVAHMLGIEGTVPELATLGPCVPMLRPEQVLFFANDNVEPFERQVIEELGIAEMRLAEVAADPSSAAEAVVTGWARQFERLLVHLDVDVLDFVDMPLAENNRRNAGLRTRAQATGPAASISSNSSSDRNWPASATMREIHCSPGSGNEPSTGSRPREQLLLTLGQASASRTFDAAQTATGDDPRL